MLSHVKTDNMSRIVISRKKHLKSLLPCLACHRPFSYLYASMSIKGRSFVWCYLLTNQSTRYIDKEPANTLSWSIAGSEPRSR